MTIHEAGVVVTIDEEQKGPCYLAEIAMSRYLSPSRPKKKKKTKQKLGWKGIKRGKKRILLALRSMVVNVNWKGEFCHAYDEFRRHQPR